MALLVFPHRLTLVRTRNILNDMVEILERERIKMADRNARKQWPLLNELLKDFNRSVYGLAREAAIEDVAFSEELIRLEDQWVNEGRLKRDDTLSTQMGWRRPSYQGVPF
jgi:hypothetical protein